MRAGKDGAVDFKDFLLSLLKDLGKCEWFTYLYEIHTSDAKAMLWYTAHNDLNDRLTAFTKWGKHRNMSNTVTS